MPCWNYELAGKIIKSWNGTRAHLQELLYGNKNHLKYGNITGAEIFIFLSRSISLRLSEITESFGRHRQRSRRAYISSLYKHGRPSKRVPKPINVCALSNWHTTWTQHFKNHLKTAPPKQKGSNKRCLKPLKTLLFFSRGSGRQWAAEALTRSKRAQLACNTRKQRTRNCVKAAC